MNAVAFAWKGFCFVLCLMLFACQSSNSATAAANIPDDKMARILADLNIAEAATARLNGYAKDSLMHVYFRQVMEMHQVTVETYEAQLREIASDPVRMDDLLRASENMLSDTVAGKN